MLISKRICCWIRTKINEMKIEEVVLFAFLSLHLEVNALRGILPCQQF